jgi:hypothetical protein
LLGRGFFFLLVLMLHYVPHVNANAVINICRVVLYLIVSFKETIKSAYNTNMGSMHESNILLGYLISGTSRKQNV